MIPTAVVAGFLAGFFGIGGGFIIIPVLFYIFNNFGIDQNYVMHLAIGTTFSIILPTAAVSVYTHYKHEAVDVNIVKSYGGFVIIGVVLGTIIAASLKTKSFFKKSKFISCTYIRNSCGFMSWCIIRPFKEVLYL